MSLIKKNQLEAFNKNDVGLGNVDNTSDANKPVSTAQQTALDLKANKDGETITNATITTSSVNGVTLTNGGAATNFLQEDGNYGPAGGGGGSFDFSFPHAKTNFVPFAQEILASTTYTPPTGKVAYLTQMDSTNVGSTFEMNGVIIGNYRRQSGQGRVDPVRPVLIGDTDTIGLTSASTSYVAGFLVDEDADIVPVATSGAYTVPANQVYIISAMYGNTVTTNLFTIGGDTFLGNNTFNRLATDVATQTTAMPVLGAGDEVIDINLNHSGYLVPLANIS